MAEGIDYNSYNHIKRLSDEELEAIGAGDQDKDGAMINHLHDLFCRLRNQSVVNAGHGIQQHHGKPVNKGADDLEGVVIKKGLDHAGHQRQQGRYPVRRR